ncbi:uncharacterized protein LOC114761174 [Neltuma alba]|uniref:uncharacterized protein LOC114761174 n=1 Tax=Neltuma alba TaxID=207710 RepID=UPI0010A400F0|nr:uncharacterized protein LOC114761174 [Prosopis alba]
MDSPENLNISLTLHIDFEKNKVLYAEADNDFVDVLLSLLTLPLATVSRLVSKESTVQPCTFNCISSLRQSVEKLDQKYFSWDWIKEKLLNPLNPMGAESKTLVYNFDDPQMSRGFAGYLRKSSCFIVADDLTLMPSDLNSTLWILETLGIDYVPEKLTVNVTEAEVLDLLKFSLWSKTPLTDLFLRKKLNIQNCQTLPQSRLMKSELQINDGWKMKLKIMISKSKRKILFAEAEEGLMDQLLSFLTIPLGVVERLAQGNAGLGCIDNLYKSLAGIDSTRYFKSDLKNKLLNPMIASRKVKNQMLPIYYKLSEASESRYACYVKQGTTFMVTDDLSAEPFSSSAALKFLRESKFVEQDLEVKLIRIGANEVYEILRAAIFTSSALTTGLSPFLNLVKQET